MMILFRSLALALLLVPALAHAQPRDLQLSAGPTLSLTGLGIGGTVKIVPMFSTSAEFSTALVQPRLDIGEIEGIDYDVNLNIWSFTLMGHYHPLGGAFAVGAGLYVGGYGLTGTGSADETITIGDNNYEPSELGEADADFLLGGPTALFEIGRRGRGFNVGIGAAVPLNTKVDLSFPSNTLSVARAAQLEDDLEQEISDVRDDLRRIPGLLFFRIGYQFGF